MSLKEVFRNTVEFTVHGQYALFSDPILRMGGERASYPVPTYQALKGVMESVYWKPSILFYIDAVRVMNPIQTEGKSIRPISYTGKTNTLSIYTYLVNPVYQVRAHFVPNPYRTEPDLIEDGLKEHKHHNIARRMIEKGGRRDIFLGTRECQAYVEPCIYGEGQGYYDDRSEIDLGVMFHSFAYPDETGKDELGVRLWHAKMTHGEIIFPKPEEINPDLYRFIRPMERKKFGGKYNNFIGLKESSLVEELAEEGEIE